MSDLTIPDKSKSLAMTDSEQAFQDLTSGSDYLPRIQLMGGNSALVQEGKATIGGYAYIRTKDDFEDLGDEIDVLVCAMRFKAMRIGDEVISIFDYENPEFQKIVQESKIKDSGCLAGPEFLLWLAGKQVFVTFYMASKSAARVAPTVRSYIAEGKPGAATLKASLVSTKKYKWHVPVCTDCSTPFDVPSQEDFIDVLDKFQNPPEDDIETVDAEDQRER